MLIMGVFSGLQIQVVRIVNGKVERMADVPFTLDDGTGRLDFIKVGD